MKMFKRKTLSLALVMAAGMFGSAAQAAVVLTPIDTADLKVGDTFEIAVSTDQNQAAFDSFQFDLTYDANAISYAGGTFDDVFLLNNGQVEPSDASGTTTVGNITGAVFMEQLSGTQELVTLEFMVKASGTSDISLSPTAGFFLALGGSAVPGGGEFSIQIAALEDMGEVIPLPAAALLFAPGLYFLRRTKQRNGEGHP